MIRIAAGALAALLAAAAAPAQTPPLVEAVSAAIEARAEPEQRWAFTRTMKRGEATVTARFDPSRPPEEAWTLLSPASDAELTKEQRAELEALREEEEPDRNIVLGSERDGEAGFSARVAEGLQLVSEDAERAVYAFAPGDDAMGGGGGGNQDFGRFIRGEMVIAKAGPMLAAMRIFAEESFKPHPIARISALDVNMSFAEAEPGGPIAMIALVNHVAGSALFQDFDVELEITNSDFERVEAAAEASPAE